MKISLLIPALTLVMSLAPLGAMAVAQPDTNNAPKAENPANRAPRGMRPDANVTPEQRLKWFVKRQFAALGADDATQETLATFVQSEMKARQELTEKSQPLQTALRAEALTDVQVAALLNTYQGALEDEKTRHAKAVVELQKTVDLKKLPKIEAALTLFGVIGDGPMVSMGRGMMGGGRGNNRGNGNANGRGRNRGGAPDTPNAAPA